MTNCTQLTTVIGCRADGAGEPLGAVVIHHEYRLAASGESVLYATRYTDAVGNPLALGVGETVTPGDCPTSILLAHLFQRLTGPYTVAALFRSVTITAVSADVTINGLPVPQFFTWSIDSDDGERYANTVLVTGTDYIITEVR